MPSIDFDKFHESVGLVAVARALRVDVIRFNVRFIRCQCPVCRHEDRRACKVNWETDIWYCHRCRRGGGPIQLASHLLNTGPYEAVIEVCKRLGIDVPWRERVRTRRPRRDRSGEILDDTEDD